MDAFFARNRLSAYLDGELSGAEAREVEDALARDATLRTEFEDLRRAVDLLRAQGVVDAPPGFADRVRDAVAKEPMPSRWRAMSRRVRPEVWLVAAVALLVVGYAGLGPKSTPSTSPTRAVDAAKVPTPASTDAEPPAGDLAPAAKDAPGDEAAPPADDAPADEVGSGDALPRSADGVLGDEHPSITQSVRSGPMPLPLTGGEAPPKAVSKSSPGVGTGGVPKLPDGVGASTGVEKDAYTPTWESPGNAAEPEAKDPTELQTRLFSPAPFQYRLKADDDRVLSQLSALAAKYGGRLEGRGGTKVAPYPMSDGDARSLRIVVPSYNQPALVQELRALGQVDTVATKDTTLVAPGTDIAVQIDVER